MFIKIPQPDLSNIDDNKIKKILENDEFFNGLLVKFSKCNSPQYQSWAKRIRYKKDIPGNLNPEEFFKVLQFIRKISAKDSPVKQENGRNFTWQELDRFQKFFHQFSKDFGARKNTQLSEIKTEIKRKKNYEGIIEEAIASSQIEGATVTREQGRKLLKSNKKPTSIGEKMILNNYKTIQLIETKWKDEKMSIELLLKIQKALTADTLKEKNYEGRLRTKKDSIEVGNELTGEIAFIPPSEKFVQKELKQFVKFANEESPFDNFIWDLARAIILHFWLAYLHPFCDGNGRTARSVFYWYLLRKDFLYIGFLPISVRIRKSKNAYEKAFLLTEQDDNNLTYFFDYIIRQLELSIKDFYEFEKNQEEVQKQKLEVEDKFSELGLNQRQIELIYHFIKHPDEFTTLARHQQYQNITYVTARKDLFGLEEIGFLQTKKKGKTIHFYPTIKIREVL